MKTSKDHSTAFAWAGLIGVAVFIIAWMSAEAVDSTWQFGVNVLCDFNSSTDAGLYFNYGCRIAGILIAIFGIGRAVYGKNAGHCLGGILLFLGGVALALVGVFTPDDGNIHNLIAVAAALLMLLAAISITAGNWAADRKVFAGLGIVIIFMVTAMYFAYDLAGLEAYGIILGMVWFVSESVNMIVSSRKG